jgi:phosphotransferase system HPr (HPr) family protein
VPARSDDGAVNGNVAAGAADLPADVDLHARPAATFVRTAMGFSARLWVAAGDREVDAKSLLSILALGAKRGTRLRLRGEGDDAADAVRALETAVAGLRE